MKQQPQAGFMLLSKLPSAWPVASDKPTTMSRPREWRLTPKTPDKRQQFKRFIKTEKKLA